MINELDHQELYRSKDEHEIRDNFAKHFRDCPIPDDVILQNLGLFLSSKNLARILFINHIYKKIIDTQGIVIEFGTRWGQNLALFSALRGIYEPFNRHRKIVGFDTFKGFPSINDDYDNRESSIIGEGRLSCGDEYPEYLEKVMEFQEQDNPISHIKKFEICAGDASDQIDIYLKSNPETIISLVYFDFDIYEPTKKCLEAIKPHLIKGSILGFDELNDPDSPGETAALNEVIGLNNIKLKRYRYASRVSYFVVD